MSADPILPGAIASSLIRSPGPARRTSSERGNPSPVRSAMVPVRSASPPKRLPPSAASPGLGCCTGGIANFRSCCEDLINFDDYPDLRSEDRAVINGFFNGDLLKDDKWRLAFPSGKFECTLQASSESTSDEFGLKEKVVFKIDFQRVACAKSIVRRVWSSKTKVIDTGSEIESESPIKTPVSRINHTRKRVPRQRRASFPDESQSPASATQQRSISFPGSLPTRRPRRSMESENGFSLIELQSPIKKASRASTTNGRKRSRSTSGKATTPAKSTKTSVKKMKPKAAKDNVWSVAAILDHKLEKGKDYFLVRWDGVNEKGKPWDDTWEPKQNISQDLIAEYWSDHRKKRSSKKLSSGKTSTKK